MNDLTLFLYVVELVGRLPILATFSTIAFFVVWFFCPPKGVKAFSYEHGGPLQGFFYAKPLLYVSLFFLTLAFLTPSKDTLYLMAGSEVAEIVVATPEAQEIVSDVKEIIDIQLEKLKK